jgi:zona occludens toxin
LIGELLLVSNDQVKLNEFWPDAKKPAPECYEGRTVQGGDLVILDECWRFFGPGQQVVPDCFAFLREHRHFVNAAGVSCDLVLISQSIQDLDRKVRVTMEKHFYMEKLKRFGLAKKYTVDVFNGYRMNRKAMLRLIRTYNRKFYPFYSSYAGKGGDEREVDKRVNVLRNPWLISGLVLGPLLLIFGGWNVYKLFSRRSFAADPVAAVSNDGARGVVAGGSVLGGPGGAAASAGGVAPVARSPGDAGQGVGWRVAGVYALGGAAPIFLLSDGSHTRFVYGDSSFRLTRWNWEIIVDGKVVTSYAGAVGGAGDRPGFFSAGPVK